MRRNELRTEPIYIIKGKRTNRRWVAVLKMYVQLDEDSKGRRKRYEKREMEQRITILLIIYIPTE